MTVSTVNICSNTEFIRTYRAITRGLCRSETSIDPDPSMLVYTLEHNPIIHYCPINT